MSFEETLYALRELMAKDDLELGTVGNVLRLYRLTKHLLESKEIVRNTQLSFIAHMIADKVLAKNLDGIRGAINIACAKFESSKKGYYCKN